MQQLPGDETPKKNLFFPLTPLLSGHTLPNKHAFQLQGGVAMSFTSNIGILLLAIYLILIGITGLVGGLSIPPIVMTILALAAGIFLLIGK